MLEPISDIKNVMARVESGGVVGAFTFVAVQHVVRRMGAWPDNYQFTTAESWAAFNILVDLCGECTIMGVMNSEIDKLNQSTDATSMIGVLG